MMSVHYCRGERHLIDHRYLPKRDDLFYCKPPLSPSQRTFPTLEQSCSTSVGERRWSWEAQCKGRKSIHGSAPLQAYMYVSSPLSIAQVDPCALCFFSVFTPAVLNPSILPAPPFISHLPLKLLQDSLGRGGKVRLKAGSSVSRSEWD